MNESIFFPESTIPVVIRIIRQGIQHEKPSITTRQLEKQCRALQDYFDKTHTDDDDCPPEFIRQ